METRLKPVVKKRGLHEGSEVRENLEHWLSLPPEERVAAVHFLRTQHHGGPQRLQRVARVLQRPRR